MLSQGFMGKHLIGRGKKHGWESRRSGRRARVGPPPGRRRHTRPCPVNRPAAARSRALGGQRRRWAGAGGAWVGTSSRRLSCSDSAQLRRRQRPCTAAPSQLPHGVRFLTESAAAGTKRARARPGADLGSARPFPVSARPLGMSARSGPGPRLPQLGGRRARRGRAGQRC